MADPIKDDCKICDIVLIGVGLALAGLLAFMAIDLATDGKLTGMLSGAGGKLASVTDIGSRDKASDSDSA